MSPILAIIITNIIWGAAPPVFKFALEGIPPFTLAFIRFFGAGLLFVPFAWKHWQKIKAQDFKDILLGGFFGVTIVISFFFLGLKWAPSINVHVISSLGPIVLYVLSLIWLKEKAHPQIMKGMIIALVGVMIIIFAPIVMGNGLDHNAVTYSSGLVLLGNIFFVISMIGNVFHTLYNKRALKHVNPYIVTCVGFLAGSVIFVPFMWQELQTWSLDQVGFHGWIGILYGLFLSSALAYFLHNFAVAKMKAQEVGVFTYIEPIVAVLVAIPLVGERPDLFFIIGSVLVFGGIYWSQQHPHYKAVNKKLSR